MSQREEAEMQMLIALASMSGDDINRYLRRHGYVPLTQQRNDMENAYREAQKNVVNLQFENNELKAQVANLQKARDSGDDATQVALEMKVSDLQRVIRDLAIRCADSEKHAANLRDSLEKCRTENAGLLAQIRGEAKTYVPPTEPSPPAVDIEVPPRSEAPTPIERPIRGTLPGTPGMFVTRDRHDIDQLLQRVEHLEARIDRAGIPQYPELK